jgi:hypothetical protein
MEISHSTRKIHPEITKMQSGNLSRQELLLLLVRPLGDLSDSTGKIPLAIDFGEKPQSFPATPRPIILRRVVPGTLNSGYRQRIVPSTSMRTISFDFLKSKVVSASTSTPGKPFHSRSRSPCFHAFVGIRHNNSVKVRSPIVFRNSGLIVYEKCLMSQLTTSNLGKCAGRLPVGFAGTSMICLGKLAVLGGLPMSAVVMRHVYGITGGLEEDRAPGRRF